MSPFDGNPQTVNGRLDALCRQLADEAVPVAAGVAMSGKSQATVYRLVKMGVIPSVVVAGRLMIPRAALLDLIQRGAVDVVTPDDPA